MTGAGPAAQVVSPDVCFYSGTVVIEGIELLDVESNSTLTPIKGAPAPQRLDDRKPHTEPYAERQRETDAVIGRSNLEWRVLGIRPRAIDSRGVDRRIDEFRIGWLDNNALAFGRYPLLRIGPERPRRRSLVAKTLDRIHDVSLLHYDRVAQLLRPVQLFVHHPQDPRKRHQRLDAGIPRLCFDRGGKLVSLEVRMSGILQPTIGFDDVERIGRGHQDLCEQCVRIERDRGEQLVELFGFEYWQDSNRRGRRRCCRVGGRRRAFGHRRWRRLSRRRRRHRSFRRSGGYFNDGDRRGVW